MRSRDVILQTQKYSKSISCSRFVTFLKNLPKIGQSPNPPNFRCPSKHGSWSVICVHALEHSTLPVCDIIPRFMDTFLTPAVLTPLRNVDLTFDDLDDDLQGHLVMRAHHLLQNTELWVKYRFIYLGSPSSMSPKVTSDLTGNAFIRLVMADIHNECLTCTTLRRQISTPTPSAAPRWSDTTSQKTLQVPSVDL